MGQIIWRTLIKFTTATLNGIATLLFDCDSINMTYGMVLCLAILDPPASQIVPPEPTAPREGEGEGDSDSSEEDETPLEQRQWPSLEAYRQAVYEGLRYRLLSSADSRELAGMRLYRTGDRMVGVFWASPDAETWNPLKGRIFLCLVGPASVTSSDRHAVASKSDCRSLGHVYLERELLGFCQNEVEVTWGLQLRLHRPPAMVMQRGEPAKDVESYWGKQPPFKPAAFRFSRVIQAPWKSS